MKNSRTLILLVSAIVILCNSCYQEYRILPDHKNNIFNFLMTPEAENEILEARGIQFYIEPTPKMIYGEVQYEMDHMKVRGGSVLNFQRKSYTVNLDKDFFLPAEYDEFRDFEKFKLISLVYDYTYIENRLAHILLKDIGLWPLHTFFTEVMLNNHHQGLYLFIEDPETNSFIFDNSEAVIRRDYRNDISSIELNKSIPTESENYYITQFKSLYSIIVDYTGAQLYAELSRHLNVQNYMRKMALDYILKNGDYTDEIFFSAKKKDGVIYFDIIPWDYDDLFSGAPHEVGRAWAVGNVFGERVYYSRDDVLADHNGRLVYSIEDDLDYIIAKDDFLYDKYLEELEYVLSKINTTTINSTFQLIKNELLAFYEKPEIIEQSSFDANSTSLEIFTTNIANKEAFLIDRITWISNELIIQ